MFCGLQEKGKIGADKLHNWFKSCHWAKETEVPSKTVVEVAITLWKKLTSVPGLLQVVREAELLYGAADSPFQSILQMNAMTLGSQKPTGQRLLWVFQCVLDMRRAGALKLEDITKNKLSDAGTYTPCDLFAYKYGVLQELLAPETMNLFKTDFVVECRRHLLDVDAFRKAFGYRNNEEAKYEGTPAAAMWRSSLQKHEDGLSS